MNYQEFQNLPSSEKVTLAVIRGSTRLLGFTSAGGGQWNLDSFYSMAIEYVNINGLPLVKRELLDDETGEGWYKYRPLDNRLVIVPFGGLDPNSEFTVLTQKYFFSSKSVNLPNDLDSGYSVPWEPLIKSTSQFEVGLNIINEETSVVEGSGKISFFNDQDLWKKKFDTVSFDNQVVEVYSWSPLIPVNEAKLLYRGFVYSRSYSSSEITLNLKDLMYNLRGVIELPEIQDLALRTDPALANAKQRLVYGRIEGHRPVNVDKIINSSYPLMGTVSVFNGSTNLVGTGTSFVSKLIPNDKLILNGDTFIVSKINSDLSLELTAAWSKPNAGNISAEVVPSTNKSYINRKWQLAGHLLHEKDYVLQPYTDGDKLVLDTTEDIYEGDFLYIKGTPLEVVKVKKVVNSKVIQLEIDLVGDHADGVIVTRPCAQNVRLNDIELYYLRDYTTDPQNGFITLREKAEENAGPLLQSIDKITVTNGDNYFTGVGTKFTSYLKAGNKVRPASTSTFFTVSKVEDEKVTLTENYIGPDFTIAETAPEIHSISGLDSYKEIYKLAWGSTGYGTGSTNLMSMFEWFLAGFGWFLIFDEEGSVCVYFSTPNGEKPDDSFLKADRYINISSIYTTGMREITPDFFNSKVKQALEFDGAWTCEIVGNDIYIKNKAIGVRPVAQPNDEFETRSITKSLQTVKVLTPDVGNSMNNKYVIIHGGQYKCAFWFNQDAVPVPPSIDGARMIRVDLDTDDTITEIRDKLKAAFIYDAGTVGLPDFGTFTITDIGTDGLRIEGTMYGNIHNMNQKYDPSYPPYRNFDITTTHYGKGMYELHGKYFTLPYWDAGSSSDKSVGFYFDVDAAGVTPPSTGADSTVAITDLVSDGTEEDFFKSLETALNDTTFFNTSPTPNSILITSTVDHAVGDDFNVGTSGLDITRVQEGVGSGSVDGVNLQYKNFVFGNDDVLTCTVYGKTDDGTINGKLIKTAPGIVRDLLTKLGAGQYLNEDAFDEADLRFKEELALVIPTKYNDKATNLTYRDTINRINSSVLGVLIQDNDFLLTYDKVRPNSNVALRLDETDILSIKTGTNNKDMSLQINVEYLNKEYNWSSKVATNEIATRKSKNSQYLSKLSNSKIFETLCTNIKDAKRIANRWSFMLENSANSYTFTTKLQSVQLQINDVIYITHEKLQDRVGTNSASKLMMVERIGKNGNLVEITAIDLSGAFNRVGKFTETTNNWQEADDFTKLTGAFYKGQYGLIDNDPDTIFTNLLW